MSKIDKCLNIALNKSTSEEESLAAFNAARRLTLNDYQSEEIPSKDFTLSDTTENIIDVITPLANKTNSLNLVVEYSVIESIDNSKLFLTVKGEPSNIKSFETFVTTLSFGKYNLVQLLEYMEKPKVNPKPVKSPIMINLTYLFMVLLFFIAFMLLLIFRPTV
jgi:hypothetical protein